MRARQDEALERFQKAFEAEGDYGTRIKDVRTTPLKPGGRTVVTLFEQVDDEGRPHPRLRTDMPPAEDAAPPGGSLLGALPTAAPADGAAFETWLRGALKAARDAIEKVDTSQAPRGSERFWTRSIRNQRLARFLAEAKAQLERWGLGDDARYALAVVADEAYAGAIAFDDANTGTYHSFRHDAPFVHYLERILESLPEEGTEAWALLDGYQQPAVARQRAQARAHLDHLMRHKYANEGIHETDIERSLGGWLIDTETRMIVSESPRSADSLRPEYEILRIEPTAQHPKAGEWVYRAGGRLHLQSGEVVDVDASLLRARAVDAEALSFRRAPHDAGLRQGVRFDWNGNGYVEPEPIGWISWAGHCDIKAIMEALGITLTEDRTVGVAEYRSDTGLVTRYDRDLLVEMVASVFELGSVYRKADNSGYIQRGIHRFGGSRNDSLPDRIQFTGLRRGEGFRWPLTGRQDAFRVTSIKLPRPNRRAEVLDASTAFFRYLPDLDTLDFTENPRYLKTVEGDYNLLDVSRAVLEVDVQEDGFDETSGYPCKTTVSTTVDMRVLKRGKRSYLGTHIKDAARREVYKVWLDPRKGEIQAELLRYEKKDGKYGPAPVSGGDVTIPLARPLEVTLSREMKRDDPSMFQALLEVAVREGQNICADTDMEAEVWNGVVTRLDLRKVAENRDKRVERWQVDLTARFGGAMLDYLVRRDAKGQPLAWCPARAEDDNERAPDFLWQDHPDVASKGFEGGEWVVNATMLERGIVTTRWQPDAEGGIYVEDEHVKNLFELIFCGLGGYRWTVVHNNKRYGFKDEPSWKAATERLAGLRAAVGFEG